MDGGGGALIPNATASGLVVSTASAPITSVTFQPRGREDVTNIVDALSTMPLASDDGVILRHHVNNVIDYRHIIVVDPLTPSTPSPVFPTISPNGTRDFIDPLRLFGFLYGTFPTAPSVFVFASHYGAQISVVATGKRNCKP